MSDIISAIHDDMDEYEYLCEKYNEQPQYKQDNWGNNLLDCYGEHAKDLLNRKRKEWIK